MTPTRRFLLVRALKATGAYALFGVLWIIASDRLLLALVRGDLEQFSRVQTFKGLIFVILTTLLIFLLTWLALHQLHRAAERLRRSEENLRRAQTIGQIGSWYTNDSLNAGVPDWQHSGRVVMEWSDHAHELLGIPRGRAIDRDLFMACVHPDDRDRVAGAIEEAMRTGSHDIEYRIVRSGGEVRWLRGRTEFRFDEEGTTTEAIGTVQDITERRLLEQARQQLMERQHMLANASPALLWTADATGRLDWVNERSLTFTGRPLQDELNWGWVELVHPDDREGYLSIFRQAVANCLPFSTEFRMLRHDGEYRWLMAQGMPRLDPASPGRCVGFIGSGLDVTREHEALEALWASEERLRLALKAGGQGIFDIDFASGRVLVSAEYAHMLGHDEGDFSETLDTLRKRIHPDDLNDYEQRLSDCLADNRHDFRAEFRQRAASGDWKWMLAMGAVIERGQNGLPLRMIGTQTDIDRIKRAEALLSSLNQVLEQRVAERTAQLEAANKELESFSYAVSHDLKAPLRGISGYSELLLEDYGSKLDTQGCDFLRKIRRGVEQMHALIEDMLAYSRIDRTAPDVSCFALDELLAEVMEQYAGTVEAGQITLTCHCEPLEVCADREGLAVILRNLLDNALKFSRDVPRPHVEVGARREGERCVLHVRDNGIGFDMQHHERIFEVFQRLHRDERHMGTGVGLALVRRAAARMGGRVWAESQPGQGACFFVDIPCAPAPAEDAGPGGGTV